jgi:hypothetical protein
MKFTSSVAVLGVVGVALAQFPLPPANTTYYFFKTSVEPGQAAAKSAYNNLYMASQYVLYLLTLCCTNPSDISASHTGAGLSDATFVKDAPLPAHKGWFNGTALNWFEPTADNSVYFGVTYNYPSSYTKWGSVTINGGPQSGYNFSLTADNKLVGPSKLWSNWLGR